MARIEETSGYLVVQLLMLCITFERKLLDENGRVTAGYSLLLYACVCVCVYGKHPFAGERPRLGYGGEE